MTVFLINYFALSVKISTIRGHVYKPEGLQA